MPEQVESAVVVREIEIAATPETVFAFLIDQEKLLRWQGVSATLDPRPGGIYLVNVTGRDIARGEFVEVVPHSRVVFTWGWEADGNPVPPASSTVEITLTPAGSGTRLRLVHRDLPNEDARKGHAEGWEHYLDRLASVAGGGDPGPDTWMTAEA